MLGLEAEELLGDLAAHHVHARVVAAVLAAPRAVVAGQRVVRTGHQLVAEHVALHHAKRSTSDGSRGVPIGAFGACPIAARLAGARSVGHCH